MANTDSPSDDLQDAEHFRAAAENASRDVDGLVAKLATAGLTVSIATAGLMDSLLPGHLFWAAACFGGAAIVALVGQRIGADSLRRLVEKTYELNSAAGAQVQLRRRFFLLAVLNWVAVTFIVAAFIVAIIYMHEVIYSTS